MVGSLLLKGMLVGLVAGLLSFAFLKLVGEPQVDRAIAFETRMDEVRTKAQTDDAIAKGQPMPPAEADQELVSRPVQAGLGLLTGVGVYAIAFGGLFALVFAIVYGRMSVLGPRATSALLAGMGFVAVYVVPNLKYPANPPSVGDPETIGMRTGLYFAAVALSIAAMIGAGMLRRRLLVRLGGWNAALAAGAAYLAVMVALALLLPSVDEVPDGFPAVLLWQFRMASIGAQAILWTVLGLGFGALTERVARQDGRLRLQAADA